MTLRTRWLTWRLRLAMWLLERGVIQAGRDDPKWRPGSRRAFFA
jgi:hypothetical protein